MKLATWNVNSVAVRLPRLCAFLERHAPDVVCLQELKGEASRFPHAALAELGYSAAVLGQKTYNGVAILARTPPTDVHPGLGDAVEDPQARLIAAHVAGVRVVCAYVPNGSEPSSDKFAYKLAWLARLGTYLAAQPPTVPLLLCGDFNVAPKSEDAANPEAWADTVLCHPRARAALAAALGSLVDLGQRHQPVDGRFTWWDYRRLGFVRNDGLRIDHIYACPLLAPRCTAVQVDRDERRGTRPSDHAPVMATFAPA